MALGIYPNRQVIDAAFSVVRDGVQRSVHASQRLGPNRAETHVGPLEIVVDSPLRVLTVVVRDAGLGLEANLTFTARTPAVQEPKFRLFDDGRAIFDYTRLTQWGRWSGTLTVDGTPIRIEADRVVGCRDRSWGVRPVGEPPGGAPSHVLPQFFWLWAPLHFDDCCTHLDVNEDADGRRWHDNGMIVPLLAADVPGADVPGADDPGNDDTGVELARSVDYSVEWQPGTRRAKRAALDIGRYDEPNAAIELEPLMVFPMRGLGYLSPDWSHGAWKGEYQVGVEWWRVDELDPVEPWNLHVQQLVRARWGDRTGVGVLEQLALNAHTPTGLTGLFDGAG
jgi:hypothetical protein